MILFFRFLAKLVSVSLNFQFAMGNHGDSDSVSTTDFTAHISSNSFLLPPENSKKPWKAAETSQVVSFDLSCFQSSKKFTKTHLYSCGPLNFKSACINGSSFSWRGIRNGQEDGWVSSDARIWCWLMGRNGNSSFTLWSACNGCSRLYFNLFSESEC